MARSYDVPLDDLAAAQEASRTSLSPVAEEPEPLVGATLDGRFHILERIGSGGMGSVYKAVQLPMNRVVAVKILDTSAISKPDPAFRKRFKLEAASTSKLRHPNTIQVFDHGCTSEGLLYIAMEYLEGQTLADLLLQKEIIPWPRALHITQQICRSLREAHRLGLVHRDLKPANVMLLPEADRKDHVKVLDFGLVKQFADASLTNEENITAHGMIVGSPQYMAPEQATGGEADPRSDIYALGVLLYEALCGRPPFQSRQYVAVLLKHVHDPPPPMDQLRPGLQIPRPVEALVMRCLEKDRARRFQSMDEMLTGIQQAVLASSEELTIPLLRSEIFFDEPTRPRTSRRNLVALGLLGFLAAAGLGAIGISLRKHVGAKPEVAATAEQELIGGKAGASAGNGAAGSPVRSPDSAARAADSAGARSPDSAGRAADSAAARSPDSVGRAPDSATARSPDSAARAADSAGLRATDSAGRAPDSATARSLDSAGRAPDSATARSPDSASGPRATDSALRSPDSATALRSPDSAIRSPDSASGPRATDSALRSPDSATALRSPDSAIRSPDSASGPRATDSALRSPDSAARAPDSASALRSPNSATALRSPDSALRSPDPRTHLPLTGERSARPDGALGASDTTAATTRVPTGSRTGRSELAARVFPLMDVSGSDELASAPVSRPVATATTTESATDAPAPQASLPTVVRTAPALVEVMEPIYTPAALRERSEGTVIARCRILETGIATECWILKGIPHMDEAVVAALKSSRFKPATADGVPVATDHSILLRLFPPK